MKTAKKLKIGKDGYVKLLRCDRGHGGNTRYALASGDYCQCQGCGAFRTIDSCIAEQAKIAAKLNQ